MKARRPAAAISCTTRCGGGLALLIPVAVGGVLLCVGWIVFSKSRAEPPGPPNIPPAIALPTTLPAAPPQPSGAPGTPAEEEADARFRRLLVGTWQDDYQGKRTMTVRADGTATMTVELSGLKATLFASRLQFEMTWAIAQGRLKKHTTGGEPAAQVTLILRTMGDRVDEPILELAKDRLLLLDQDGKTRYQWRRVR